MELYSVQYIVIPVAYYSIKQDEEEEEGLKTIWIVYAVLYCILQYISIVLTHHVIQLLYTRMRRNFLK